MFKYFYKHPIVTGFIGFLIFFLITQMLTYKEYNLIKSEERQLVVEKATQLENQLSTGLNLSLSATKTLEMLLERIDLKAEFESVASEILLGNPFIDAIQLLDSGVITHVYPHNDKKSGVGHDILKDKTRKTEAIRAIENRTMFFAGPFELKQGGRGIVGRLPIFRDNRFVGFTAVVTKLDTFYKIIGYESLDTNRYYYQFSKLNPDSGQEEFFLPLATTELSGYKAVMPIDMGDWILTVQLRESTARGKSTVNFLLRFLFSVLCGAAIWYLANQPYKLNRKVKEQAKAIQLSNERFTYAVQATSDAIWDWDIKNDRIYRADNFNSLFGHPKNDQTNTNQFWIDSIHPDDVEHVKSNLANFFESEYTNWIQEFRFRRADNTYAYIVDKGILIRDKKGKPVRMIGALRDISRIKETEFELASDREFLNSLLENLSDGIVACTDTGKLTMFNKASRNLYGIENIMLTPEQWDESCAIYDSDGITPLLKTETPLYLAMNGEEVKNMEIVIHPKGLEPRVVLCSGKAIYSEYNKMLGAVVVLRDITESRAREKELIKISNELVDRAKELESSNRELEQFAHTVSHDLQEPLRMITSFMKLLETKYEPILDEKGKKYIHYAIDGASRMRQIILDLLGYSTSGNSDKQEKVCLSKVMAEILEIEKHQIDKLGAIVKVGPLPVILGSRISMFQLLKNLLENALKYRDASKVPEICIHSSEVKDYHLITVEDNGIGIIPEQKDTIFQLFKRLHTSEEYSGTGIGLALAKKIVENHSGKIWTEPNINGGSKFMFTLKQVDEIITKI